MVVSKVIAAIVVALLLKPTYNFLRNYREAKKMGLPIFATPVVTISPITWIISPFVFPFMALFPAPIRDWAKYGSMFWMYHDRYQSHERFGPAFLIVSPGETSLIMADVAAGNEVLSRPKQFINPPVLTDTVKIFGPTINSVNGETWNRHRRILTPSLNEKTSVVVWRESIRQANDMLDSWLNTGRVLSLRDDLMKLALHVLCLAGFGQRFDYEVGITRLSNGHDMSYRDSLAYIFSDIITAMMSVQLPFPLPLPRFRRMEHSMTEFKKYMVEMMEEERWLLNSQPEPRDNLISVMVRAADASKVGHLRNSLTEEEVLGNLFIWNFAGYDNTTGMLAYAITLLSVHTHIQEWVREEINNIFGESPLQRWDYNQGFPRLKRCLAILYETLRLYGPSLNIPKTTNDTPQTLHIKGKELLIPRHYHVTVNLTAIHNSPESWGEDALVWNPRRFIRRSADTDTTEEIIHIPDHGAFMPWSSGPRACPGKKFASVEFVAAISCLFRNHGVRAVSSKGESPGETRARVLEVINDSSVGLSSPTLRMRHPEKVELVWERVEGVIKAESNVRS